MSRGFRMCVAKVGRGSLRPSYGRPKLALVSRFVATKIRCNEKLTLLYFSSDRLETNRTWTPIWSVHVLSVSKRSDKNTKVLVYRQFPCHDRKKMLWVRVRSILMPPTSHIASLNCHTPKFSGNLTWCQPLSSRAIQTQITQIRVHQKRWFLRCFCKESIFLAKHRKNWLLGPNSRFFSYRMSHIFWKLLIWQFIWYIWDPATCILWPVRFFVTLWFATGNISWNLVLWFKALDKQISKDISAWYAWFCIFVGRLIIK